MEPVRSTRCVLGALWMMVAGIAIAGIGMASSQLLLLAFGGAALMTLMTIATARLAREERLIAPVAYRVASGAVFVTAIAGIVLGLVPHASDTSQVLAVFFGIAAFVAYRAMVAPGPRGALIAVVIAMWSWLPFTFFLLMGCRRFPRTPPWTEVASFTVLRALLLLLPVLAAAAVFCFARRDDELPEARLV